MVYSPLGLVPKKEQGEFRVIHDLSFPKTNSVNSHILPEFTAVTFQMLDHCVEQLVSLLGKGAYIAKADFQDAFRIIPVSPVTVRFEILRTKLFRFVSPHWRESRMPNI